LLLLFKFETAPEMKNGLDLFPEKFVNPEIASFRNRQDVRLCHQPDLAPAFRSQSGFDKT
jgi:hypothetical protein